MRIEKETIKKCFPITLLMLLTAAVFLCVYSLSPSVAVRSLLKQQAAISQPRYLIAYNDGSAKKEIHLSEDCFYSDSMILTGNQVYIKAADCVEVLRDVFPENSFAESECVTFESCISAPQIYKEMQQLCTFLLARVSNKDAARIENGISVQIPVSLLKTRTDFPSPKAFPQGTYNIVENYEKSIDYLLYDEYSIPLKVIENLPADEQVTAYIQLVQDGLQVRLFLNDGNISLLADSGEWTATLPKDTISLEAVLQQNSSQEEPVKKQEEEKDPKELEVPEVKPLKVTESVDPAPSPQETYIIVENIAPVPENTQQEANVEPEDPVPAEEPVQPIPSEDPYDNDAIPAVIQEVLDRLKLPNPEPEST